MVSGPSVTGWLNDLIFSYETGFQSDFIVADIHTQPTDEVGNVVGHVYHVGNGYINNGIFLAPNPVNPEQLIAFAGPVSSFHYEVTNDFYRYNDQEWAEKFNAGTNLPLRPDWIAGYISGPSGEAMPAGRELKGTICNTSGFNPPVVDDIDYLLAYPNPARGNVNLRFVLNRSGLVSVEVYNSEGSLVSHPFIGILSEAEHDIPVSLAGLQKGLYMLKIQAGEETIFRKVVVL
jgi:hypothetical protein